MSQQLRIILLFCYKTVSKGGKVADLLLKHIRRLVYQYKVRSTDMSQINALLIFVGNARSGTTLVRTLLDSHPNAIISNEANALNYMLKGESWLKVTKKILINAIEFNKSPIWTGYSYRLEKKHVDSNDILRVIGDKKAGGTAKILFADPSNIDQLLKWSPVPVLFLHCVRHPFDVIARKTTKNGRTLDENIRIYFQQEQVVAQLADKIGQQGIFHIIHEELIAEPTRVLSEALAFLGLPAEDDYLQACQTLIFDQPKISRHEVQWSAQSFAMVQKQTRQLEHLSGYLDKGQLIFDDTV